MEKAQDENCALDRINRLFKMNASSLDVAVDKLDEWVNKKNDGIDDLNYKLFYFDSMQELSKDISLEEEEEDVSDEFNDNQNTDINTQKQNDEPPAWKTTNPTPQLHSNIELQTIPLIIPDVPDVPIGSPKQRKSSYPHYILVISLCVFVFLFNNYNLF
ncbi:hypothetical protein GPJ56_010163 [Histomonas meleagridis]|uniref:uncharacterized protein n=1 Tax=Histomonas meleagridis TaxID=135588 RepID=UPI003559AC8E|nr:hypothetical protein GPJ56_010163 [Histomonas meleagridis]KAH0804699.1 hypothetical protein GO595_002393 [Histomonas meleagridis]